MVIGTSDGKIYDTEYDHFIGRDIESAVKEQYQLGIKEPGGEGVNPGAIGDIIRAKQLFRSLPITEEPDWPITIPGTQSPTFHPGTDEEFPNVYSLHNGTYGPKGPYWTPPIQPKPFELPGHPAPQPPKEQSGDLDRREPPILPRLQAPPLQPKQPNSPPSPWQPGKLAGVGIPTNDNSRLPPMPGPLNPGGPDPFLDAHIDQQWDNLTKNIIKKPPHLTIVPK